MRSPKGNEILIIIFSMFTWFTLTADPELLSRGGGGKSGDIYATYVSMAGSQKNIALISIVVTLLYFLSLFIRNYFAITIIHLVGLIYYLFISAGYLLNYPNMALPLFLIVAGFLFADLMVLIDKQEDAKKEKILKRNNILSEKCDEN